MALDKVTVSLHLAIHCLFRSSHRNSSMKKGALKKIRKNHRKTHVPVSFLKERR